MPVQLSKVAIQQFHDQFTNAYQAAAQLTETANTVAGARGDAYLWPLQGDAAMEPRLAPQSLIPVASNDYAQVRTTFENYILNLPVDIFQQAELIIDTLSQLGLVHAKAAGRREDQFLLNALYAAGNGPLNTNTQLPDQEPPGLVQGDVGNTTAVTGGVKSATNLNVEKIIQAAALLDQANVPHEDRYLAIDARMMAGLMSNGEEPTNILYNNTKNLMQGGIDTFMGFKIFTLGFRQEGGITLRPPAGLLPGLLPPDGPFPNPTPPPATYTLNNTVNSTAIAWHKGALGCVYSLNPVTEVEWAPAYQSWLTISRLRMGASALLGKGIVYIDCDNTAAPTIV